MDRESVICFADSNFGPRASLISSMRAGRDDDQEPAVLAIGTAEGAGGTLITAIGAVAAFLEGQAVLGWVLVVGAMIILFCAYRGYKRGW
jgi:hypothetical protein